MLLHYLVKFSDHDNTTVNSNGGDIKTAL